MRHRSRRRSPLHAPRPGGFTLLEILIVMVIIGVLATLVSLAVSGRAVDDRMQAESRRLEELLRLASDEAQAKGVELGFRQTIEGFEFLTPDTSGGEWAILDEGLFRRRQVPPPFLLELRIDGRLVKPVALVPLEKKDDAEESDDAADDRRRKPENRIEPQVLILSTGEMTAFTLDLKLQDISTYYRVEGNELGQVSSQRIEERK